VGTNTNTTHSNAVQIGSNGLVTGDLQSRHGRRQRGRRRPFESRAKRPASRPPRIPRLDRGPSTSGVPSYAGQSITNATVTLSPGLYTGLITGGQQRHRHS